jgi:hypothetical protein
MPFAYAQLNIKHFRRIILHDFPYKIIYHIKRETKTVFIFAVLHTARSNKFLKEKQNNLIPIKLLSTKPVSRLVFLFLLHSTKYDRKF